MSLKEMHMASISKALKLEKNKIKTLVRPILSHQYNTLINTKQTANSKQIEFDYKKFVEKVMKLAEALLLRADMQKKISSLRERIKRNVLSEEGSTPIEDPNTLIQDALQVSGELEKLVLKINVANLQHSLPDGKTLTEAMANRDSLAQRHAILQTAIDAAQSDSDRYSHREIKRLPAVNVATLQKQIEDIARQIRELNARIQEANWQVTI